MGLDSYFADKEIEAPDFDEQQDVDTSPEEGEEATPEPSIETPEVPEGETATPTEKEPKDAPTFDSLWEEKMAEKYGKFDEFESNYESLKKKAEQERYEDKYSDESKELLEKTLGSGFDMNSLKKIVDIQTLDVDSLDNMSAIAKKLELSDGLSKAEIKVELKEFSKLNKDQEDLDLMDEDERDEYDAKLAKFNRFARESKSFLGELKDKDDYKLPTLKGSPVETEAQQAEQTASYEAAKKNYETNVDGFLNDFKQVDLKLGENDFAYELSEEQKAGVKDAMYNINSFYKNFITEEGTDYSKMANQVAKMMYSDDMLKAVGSQQANDGKLGAIKDVSNIDMSTPDTKSVNANTNPYAELGRKMRGENN